MVANVYESASISFHFSCTSLRFSLAASWFFRVRCSRCGVPSLVSGRSERNGDGDGGLTDLFSEAEVEGVLLVVAGCDEFEVGVLGMALLQGLHDLAAHFSGQHTWVRSRTHSPRQDCGQLVRLTGLLVIC
jgi:hypothetical protein